MAPPSRFWADLTTTDFAALDAERTVAVLPVGATEQHGPHLPLRVDQCLVDGIVMQALAQLPAEASVLVLPNTASAISARYTSPLKLFEYLTIGRPIVASDFPATREVLEDRRTALLVPPGDARALARALTELQSDAQLRLALGSAATFLGAKYTWEARAKRLDAALEAAHTA